jgi:hypothetical protein
MEITKYKVVFKIVAIPFQVQSHLLLIYKTSGRTEKKATGGTEGV